MPTVLVIDADTEANQVLCTITEPWGAEVSVIADGQAAITRARQDKPGIIVLCVELPGISGYSICNKLRRDPELMAVPLVLTSSQATQETFDEHARLKTHADAYLHKPYDADRVKAAFERALMPKKRATASDVIPSVVPRQSDAAPKMSAALDDVAAAKGAEVGEPADVLSSTAELSAEALRDAGAKMSKENMTARQDADAGDNGRAALLETAVSPKEATRIVMRAHVARDQEVNSELKAQDTQQASVDPKDLIGQALADIQQAHAELAPRNESVVLEKEHPGDDASAAAAAAATDDAADNLAMLRVQLEEAHKREQSLMSQVAQLVQKQEKVRSAMAAAAALLDADQSVMLEHSVAPR